MSNFNQPPGDQPPQGGPPPGGYGAPPPGGYGAPPPGAPAPYAPPMQYAPSTMPGAPIVGSFGLGFAAGFLGGCIGAGLVYALAKGPETKRGAKVGFIVQLVLGGIFRVIAAAQN